jgi:hypothetical protein
MTENWKSLLVFVYTTILEMITGPADGKPFLLACNIVILPLVSPMFVLGVCPS